MKKKVLNLAIIFTILISAMVMLTGCGKKYGKIEIKRSAGTFTDAELEYVIEDESILNFDHMETKSNIKKDEVGGSYKEIYYFTGKKEGTTHVKFTIKDGRGDVFEEHNYEVSVNKDLDIQVTEK